VSFNSYYNSITARLQAKIYAFMDDIRRGTNIFEGRRSIEEQISEEYHARFLIELIQNADDACGKDGQILIVIRQEPSPRIVVCNTGKGFSQKNFESLCTLGLTDKNPEEAIGNKGLGFRSVLEVCKVPAIYSSDIDRPGNTQPNFDGYCFCFDPDALVNSLREKFESNGILQMTVSGETFRLLENNQPGIVESLNDSLNNPEILERICKWLPVYEMPIPIKVSDPLMPWAAKLGFATAVSIGIKPGAETIFRQALAEIQPYTFLFLRNAKNIFVYREDSELRKMVEFVRAKPSSEMAGEVKKGYIQVVYHDRQTWAGICGKEPETLWGESQKWWFYKKPLQRKDFEDALSTLPERWHQIRQVDVEVAVPIGGNTEGRFSIYLPTFVKTGTGAWINAPFYGSIDRKSIEWDRKWNSTILSHAVSCVKDMVSVLRSSHDIEFSQAILRLLGIIDPEQALSKEQISSESIVYIVKEEDWVLSEPTSKGELEYKKISEITLPGDLTWKVDPVKQVLDIECREKIPLLKPHPELPNQELIENTAKTYGIETKTPTDMELARLAEIVIRSLAKNKQGGTWWNSLYRWLGHLDIPYDALVGKNLIWTQTGIYKVEKESKIFSPPRRPVASDDEDIPMIKKFQNMLTKSLPAALRNRVSFLHPEIDLGDKQIRSFLIREYRGEQVVTDFRTEQVADFILNRVCRDLYKERMSKKRKKDAAEIFAWTFILWKQMRGESQSVDWSHLLVPTEIGYRPGNETYAGKAWTGDEGADLEKVFQNAEPKKPFVVHPNTLIQMLPKIYQDMIASYNLKSDLKQFILETLGVWTAPKLNILKAARLGNLPELCPSGSNYSLNTDALRDIPDKFKLPVSRQAWERYLKRLENESKDRPFQMQAKYVLNQIPYIEETPNPVKDVQALARCMGRGWERYYRKHMTANIRRDPRESGESKSWNVTGFVVEQLSQTEWIPSKVWATKIIEGRETSHEFSDIAKPEKTIKINKDLFGPGSAQIYSLLPHIDPAVEDCISEELCEQIGIVVYSPQKEVQDPFHIMDLLCKAQKNLPTEREHFLLSLWQDLVDSAVSQPVSINPPDSVLAYEIQQDGGKRYCWLKPVEDDDSEKYTAWVNDNDDCLSLLPPGTLIVCAGKARTRWKDRVTILQNMLKNEDVRRLSDLKIIPEFEEVDGWSEPRLMNDVFPWLVQPALAMLAFGRGTKPMSVANPEGDFQKSLLPRIQNSRARYVRNLMIKIEGLDVEPESRPIFYSSSKKILYLDIGVNLKLRDLAFPLSLLFDREDYLKPAEIWLRDIEESTSDSTLREDVPSDIAIEELHIDAANLQELFQVIGGQTQQIIRSVAPALFSLCKSGNSPLSAEEFSSTVNKIADSGKSYDLSEHTMANMLNKCGISESSAKANSLRQLAAQMRDASEISKKAYDLFKIDLKDWNSAACEIGARTQLVKNDQASEAFNKAKQETRWAACGFLQKNLEGSRKEEFKERWLSYDNLKPSESIHDSWMINSSIIESPILDWFKTQAADLMDKPDLPDDNKFLESIKGNYDSLHRDPDIILDSNINSITNLWKRFRILLASLALRGAESDRIISDLKVIEDNAFGNWAKNDEKLSSSLSVGLISNEEIFRLLCEWIATQSAVVKKPLEGTKTRTLDDFIKANKITQAEELKAEERLVKEPKSPPKQTIARNSLEIPEKDQPLDSLKNKLDQILKENNKEMINKLTLNANIDLTANLGEKPEPRAKTKKGKGKIFSRKGKDTEFIGYVAEYLVFRALKNRYPHIGLREWVSGNKERFFPGSKGDDSLGYDFCISVDGRRVMIEVKSHTGDQSYFDLGSTELDAAQEALERKEIYQIWVIRNLEGELDIDHLPNPMSREHRKHFRFEVGRVYYRTKCEV
jgi:hypothetical protein